MPVSTEPAQAPAEQKAADRGSPFAVIRGLAGLTMISRILGLVRVMLMAMAVGTGLYADAFFLAWAIPNLARRLFGEGAFSAALVPVFVEARVKGDDAGALGLVQATVTRLAFGLTGLVLVLQALCAVIGSTWGQGALASLGVGAAKVALAAEFAQILLPYLVLICLAGVLGGALNALDRFAVPAAAPIVLNLVWIGALVLGMWTLTGEHERVRLLAFLLVGGGVLQLLMHTRSMKGAGFPIRPRLTTDPARLKRVRTLFFSVALGLALFQLNVLLDSLIAYTLVAEGGVSTLYYANRLVQLPIGVLGVALSTAIFPALARLVKEGDLPGLGSVVDRGLSLGAFVAIPCAVGLVVLAEPIVHVLFERGRFDATSTARTGWVLLLLAPAVLTACVTPVVTRAFYAEEEVATPVRVGVVCVVLNLTLNLLLVGPMAEAGLALATSISQGVNLIAQTWLYRRRRTLRGDAPRTGKTLRAVATYSALAAVMGAVAYGVHALMPGHAALRLAAAVLAGAILYGSLAWVLRLEAPRLLLERRR